MGLVVIAGIWFGTGCSHFDESGLPGSAASLARDRMMLVREDPPTFGHYRLRSLRRAYPELAGVIDKQGTPDFIAETRHSRYEYLIFYYLNEREAYAIKVGRQPPHQVKASGPYSITDSEYEILDGFREGSL